MCGIAGFFGEGSPGALPDMLQMLRHRGPDDAHHESGPGFGLGACRLSILDTAHGRQPMWSEDRGVCAAQNGEIYNSPGLREELKTRGRRFQGHCDTEILAPLYQEYEENAWNRLEGMFAVGLWDARRQKGYLIRDRCGKKPLYYSRIGGALYFASEIKALLAVPGCSRQIDPEAIEAYLGLKHIPGPASAFRHIRQVPPGHVLTWEGSCQQVRVGPYWTFSPQPEAPVDPDEVASKFLGLLRDAVERRLLSDVPVGFFLSGGLDSSLVTALAAEVSSTPIQTFTLTLDDGHATPGKEADRAWASWVARRFQTRHREEKIEVAHLANQMRDVVRCFDEPFAGVISPYFLSRAMARHVKVALCGDGADELFGSYLSHRLGASLEPGPHAYRRTKPEEEMFGAIGSDSFPVWRSRLEVFTGKESRALLAPGLCPDQGQNPPENRWRQAAAPFVRLSPLNQVLAAEFVTLLPDQILKYADRLSMAHSLEVRSPFLDRTVVEYVAGLPAEWKIRGQETKYLMRLAAARYFPREMIERPKEGFLMPVAQWLRTSLRPLVEECLETGRLQKQGILHPPEVARWKQIWEQGDPADYRLANKIYSLLMLSLWAEAYVR